MEEDEKSTTNTIDDSTVFEQVELMVPENTPHQEGETDENDQEQEEIVHTKQSTLSNYQLARDRQRRQIKTPARYAQADTVLCT